MQYMTRRHFLLGLWYAEATKVAQRAGIEMPRGAAYLGRSRAMLAPSEKTC
jgi:hypothetical protein